jgi:hypothetical protein
LSPFHLIETDLDVEGVDLMLMLITNELLIDHIRVFQLAAAFNSE